MTKCGAWLNPRRELPRLHERVIVKSQVLDTEYEIAIFRGDSFALMSGRYQGRLIRIAEVREWLQPLVEQEGG